MKSPGSAENYDVDRDVWMLDVVPGMRQLATCPDPDTAVLITDEGGEERGPEAILGFAVMMRESYSEWQADIAHVLELAAE